MSNSNINLQTQSSNALHNAIMEAGSKDRPPMLAPVNSSTIVSKIHHTRINGLRRQFQLLKVVLKQLQRGIWRTIRMFHKTYGDQMNAEAEAVQIILTGIDNDIYSTVDACQCPFLLQLPPEWQRFVTLVNKSQDAEDCLLSQAFMTILEANTRMKSMKRTEILARTAIHLHLLLNNKFLSSKPSYTKHSIFLPPPASNSLPETKEKQLFTSSLLLPTYIQTS
ncbi:hypothetical protein Tco_0556587 [Tanacetum coccineum]